MKNVITSALLLALLSAATATAHDFEVDGIYYNINGNEAAVTFKGSDVYDYSNEYSGSVIIPATVTYDGTTYPVTSIDDSAFYECKGLTSIDIPNSVTSIGNRAFYECWELTSIDIPNSVTEIGEFALYTCIGLTSIVIPDAVTEIGDWTFAYCESLTDINIPNSVTSIGEYAFIYCIGLTSIAIPNAVTEIGNSAFAWCTGLTSINIPNSVTEIGDEAFRECAGLEDVYCYIADLSRVSSGNEQFYLYNWNYSGRTLHVLKGTADAYRADENWYPYFGQIVDDLIETPRGDVNGDGEVNIADINAVIAIILGGNGDTAAADVNGDGEVNIADINSVIAIILRGEDEPEHAWVDLGLPSGTLWATCNVGADSPEQYGDYFAWGETEPKEAYNWETYKWCDGSLREQTKYCTKSSYGTVDGKTELDPEDDAAQVNWGPSWRMPTLEQLDELCNCCTWHWIQMNGVNGYRLTGPNGNAIFLPAADCRHDDYPDIEGSFINYWSRTLDPDMNALARVLSSISEDVWNVYYGQRDYGYSVRAVRMSTK